MLLVNFTDSSLVVWGEDKEFKQFVQNRLVEIRSYAKPEQWNYCPTKVNLADFALRGLLASKLEENELWWHGPAFLKERR